MHRLLNTVLLILSLVACAWYFAIYGQESYPFCADSMGYYMYLPSTVIYHNHKALDWLPKEQHFDNSVRSYLTHLEEDGGRSPKGYIMIKYTYGVAAFELPFFAIAHAYEKMTGKDATGYSVTYRYMVKVASVFYALLGLFILYRILKVFFDANSACTGTLLVLMGTNLFWFTFHQAGMAHPIVFFLYASLIYLTILIHKTQQLKHFLLAGLTAGFITIIRPTDVICLLIPLLYNVYNSATFRQKIALLSDNIKSIVLFAFAFMLPIIPQLLYWKKFAGSFFYYSYGKESFNWLHPKIMEGLFSFANGWFIYTPVMLLAIAGLVLYRKVRPVLLLSAVLLPLYIYIIYSWYCFNYINGLGSRPMIHLYPLLAIPLTAFLQYIATRKLLVKLLLSGVVVFCVALNLSFTLQQARGIIVSEEANRAYVTHMLFRMHPDYNDMVLYDVQQVQPAINSVKKVATIACENYEDSTSDHFVKDPTGASKYVYHMADDEEYHPKNITVTYHRELFKNAQWIRCSGKFMCPKLYAYHKHLLTLDLVRNGKTYSWTGCKIDNKIGLAEPGVNPAEFTFSHNALNRWGEVHFFIKIPPEIVEGDLIRLDIWNIGKQEMYMDDTCLELYGDKD